MSEGQNNAQKADRAGLIAQCAQADWDIVVIGGGITGAGILLEAARRGLKVLLVEQRDFAWGTSSRSSKLVHGGPALPERRPTGPDPRLGA
jgi:glycerol-3-phosphate dehydrogenase